MISDPGDIVFEQAKAEVNGPAPIKPPIIESLGPGAGYQAHFINEQVRMTIENLRQSRDGVLGDLRVEQGPYGIAMNYHQLTEGRIVLLSLSHRGTWATILAKRVNGVKWPVLLDTFCSEVLRAEQHLEQHAIELRNAVRPLHHGMLIEPLLMGGPMPTLWYGDGGSAKSFLMLAGAISLHAGIPVIGKLRPAHKLRVLICDFEFDDFEHKERMRKLLHLDTEAADSEMPDIAYLDCKGGTIVNQLERIMNTIRYYQSEYLIIDSISYAADGPLNDDETARVYYRCLSRVGLPSLSTGHIAKNGNPEYPFGSVHWKNLSRLSWHFQVADTSTDSTLNLMLECTKISTNQKVAPMGLSMNFKPQAVDIEIADVKKMSTNASPLWKRIKSFVQDEGGGQGVARVALALGVDLDALYKAVHDNPQHFHVDDSFPLAEKLYLIDRGHEF